jgi:hypothetical protein
MKKRFLYRAHAVGFSASLTAPFQDLVEAQAPVALSEAGGYGSTRVENFRYKEFFAFDSVSTQVSGIHKTDDDSHHTLVSCVIENLNLLNQVTADRVIAHVTSARTEKMTESSINALGSRFENLRIAGQPVDIELDLDGFAALDTFAKLKKDAKLKDKLSAGVDAPAGDAAQILCTLAKPIKAPGGTTADRNSVTIPGFGTIYFAEFLASPSSRRLTMFRVQLGSPVGGCASGGQIDNNGSYYP